MVYVVVSDGVGDGVQSGQSQHSAQDVNVEPAEPASMLDALLKSSSFLNFVSSSSHAVPPHELTCAFCPLLSL